MNGFYAVFIQNFTDLLVSEKQIIGKKGKKETKRS